MVGYFEKTRIEDILVERVNLGKVTLIESKVFWERLRDDILEGNKKIIADLSNCKSIDSSLIGVIIRAQDLLHKNHGILKIVTPCSEILEIFELIKVSANLNIYEILDDAVKSFNVKAQIDALAVAS